MVSIAYISKGSNTYSVNCKSFLQNTIMSSELHQRIRFARKKSKQSQAVLAKACGVSRNAVTQWESDDEKTRTKPSIEKMFIIHQRTGFPLEWLMSPNSVLNEDMEQITSDTKPIKVLGKIYQAAEQGKLTEDHIDLLETMADYLIKSDG